MPFDIMERTGIGAMGVNRAMYAESDGATVREGFRLLLVTTLEP